MWTTKEIIEENKQSNDFLKNRFPDIDFVYFKKWNVSYSRNETVVTSAITLSGGYVFLEKPELREWQDERGRLREMIQGVSGELNPKPGWVKYRYKQVDCPTKLFLTKFKLKDRGSIIITYIEIADSLVENKKCNNYIIDIDNNEISIIYLNNV